jgi:hypothetical protein
MVDGSGDSSAAWIAKGYNLVGEVGGEGICGLLDVKAAVAIWT